MVTVKAVQTGSLAAKKHILPGDILISINDHPVNDVLDYRFYLTDTKVKLLLHREAALVEILIRKDEYSDIGLEFDTFLMDEKKHCTNKCIFCFIDQMPGGMRDSLYFKDDDSRLSFLMGNYVTMTNFTDTDVDRIIAMHMSPIRISVHTTDPDLRIAMMKNPRAGAVLSYLERFRAANITMECQIVLCRGINDGQHLARTIHDLSSLFPAVNSVSVVPAGLTDHRTGLCHLTPFTPAECAGVIDQVEAAGAACLRQFGKRIFFASDEFYLTAKRPLPAGDFYEGYPQIENGVGMITSMQEEFAAECENISDYNLDRPRHLSIATGFAAYDFIQTLVGRLQQYAPALQCHVYPITNDFFGHQITVAGLITGRDIINQLRGKELGDRLLIPAVMLRHEADRFLDDKTPAEVSQELNVPICISETDGVSFVESVLYDDGTDE